MSGLMRRAMRWGALPGRMTVGIAGMLVLLACQTSPEMLSAPVTGYNHTSATINSFTINGPEAQILVRIWLVGVRFVALSYPAIGARV